MADSNKGWDWFDDIVVVADEDMQNSDISLALAFAKCLRGDDGERIIRYLRSITLERALGPDASDSLLRHVEGQRQLVAHIMALVDRGRGGIHQ